MITPFDHPYSNLAGAWEAYRPSSPAASPYRIGRASSSPYRIDQAGESQEQVQLQEARAQSSASRNRGDQGGRAALYAFHRGSDLDQADRRREAETDRRGEEETDRRGAAERNGEAQEQVQEQVQQGAVDGYPPALAAAAQRAALSSLTTTPPSGQNEGWSEGVVKSGGGQRRRSKALARPVFRSPVTGEVYPPPPPPPLPITHTTDKQICKACLRSPSLFLLLRPLPPYTHTLERETERERVAILNSRPCKS